MSSSPLVCKLLIRYARFVNSFAACGEESFNLIQRSTYVYMKDRVVPYPFQNNINVLEIDDQLLCLNGLMARCIFI